MSASLSSSRFGVLLFCGALLPSCRMYVLLNRMMAACRETRRRNLVYAVQRVVPVSNRLRLYQTNESQVSLEEIYDQSCSIRGIDPDRTAPMYHETLSRVEGHEANTFARLRVFNEICNSIV